MFIKVALLFISCCTAFAAEIDLSAIDIAMKKYIHGETIDQNEQKRCDGVFKAYWNLQTKRFGVDCCCELPEPDRTDVFIEATKMAIIYPREHGGWPFRSCLKSVVAPELLKRVRADDKDPFMLLAAPICLNNASYRSDAFHAFDRLLAAEPTLAKVVLQWCCSHDHDANWIFRYYKGIKNPEIIMGLMEEVHKESNSRDTCLALGSLYESLGNKKSAHAMFIQAKNQHNCLAELVDFYKRDKDAKAPAFANDYREFIDKHFTNRMQKVSITDFFTPPETGAMIEKSNRSSQTYGLRDRHIIVAIDGIRVENAVQYKIAMALSAQKPETTIISWDGMNYKEHIVEQSNTLCLGAKMANYPAATPATPIIHNILEQKQ